MILFDEVSVAYVSGAESVLALDNVSLAVAPGEIVALLGANGSGKSTLARLANGILLPFAGRVTVDDLCTGEEADIRSIRQHVGMVFQRPDDQIVATSVEDDIAFGPENLGLPRQEIRRRVDEALATVGLAGLERSEPHLLSGGQKQRLAIAGALAMSPAYLVLDEPTSMLDPHGRLEVLAVVEKLRGLGHGVLLVTHDLSDALRADRAVVLERGRVAYQGGIQELLTRHELLAQCSLERPPIVLLAEELRSRGISVPGVPRDPEELAEALWA